MLLIAFVLLAAAFLLGICCFYRISRNVGLLTLEDYARRNHVTFLPVSERLLQDLETWSQPLRIKLDNHAHPLLATLSITTQLKDEPDT